VVLNTCGAISETGGSIAAPSLITNSVAGTTLNGANTVGSFNGTNATSGDIALTNSGDFNLGTVTNSAASSAASGGIIIGGDSSITQTGNLTTSGGAISVTANTNLTMNGTTAQSFGAYGGQISYKATNGNVQLGLLDVGTGYVYVVAGGNITDGNGASVNNIKAFNASLLASNADGGPGSINVDTQVQFLTVDNSLVYSTSGQTNNPVTVRNSGSVLYVTVYSAPATMQLTITNDNTINVGHIGDNNFTIGPVGATNTTLTATGGSSDITVICNCGTLLSAGNIVLNAGRDILVNDVVVAGGTVTATAGRDIRVVSSFIPTYIQAANGIDLTMLTGGLFIDGTSTNLAYLLTTSGNINLAGGSGVDFAVTSSITAPLGSITATSPYGAINVNGTVSAASIYGQGSGITLGHAITASGTGDAIVLNAGTGNFINNAGATALNNTGGGRWLVYSTDPALDTFGGLASGNVALLGKTYATYPPASVVETGNRYLFSLMPTLTVSAAPPVVVDEIVDTSNQRPKKPEDVVVADTSNSKGTDLQSLPMCRP
jgi:hypothetical protein